MKLGELGVGTEGGDLIVTGKPKVDEKTELSGEVGVVGGNGPSLTCVDELGGVETEHLSGTERAHRALAEGAAEGMRGVEEERNAVILGDGGEAVYRAGAPPAVEGKDGAGVGATELVHGGRVEVVRARVNIGKNGG